MTVYPQHLPSKNGLGSFLIAAGLTLGLLVAVLSLLGVARQRVQLDDVRRVATVAQNQATAAQAAALANEQGLRKANSRLEAAGKATVPIPAPQAGRPGATGATGATGAAGASGAAGIAGRDGVSVIGPQGATGPAGAAGKDGASGTNGTDGATVTGPAGPAGQDGKDGTDGKDGAAGAPPFSWTQPGPFGPQTCRRSDPFDPAQPTYTCTTDAP